MDTNNKWRVRPSADILNLKVCDPAVGSGTILVAACRYLADRVVHAWRAEGDPRAAETATAADDPNRRDVDPDHEIEMIDPEIDPDECYACAEWSKQLTPEPRGIFGQYGILG